MAVLNGPARRILHVLRAMNCAGAETAMMNVYRVLQRRGVQFDFAVMTPEPAYYDSEIARLGGRVLPLPDPCVAGLTAYYRALRGILYAAGPFRAVHSHVHLFSGVVLRAAAGAGVPVRIAHSHTAGGEAKAPWRAPYRGLMKALIRRHATNLVGVSRAASADLFGGAGAASQVLQNGIDLAPYADLPGRREARQRLGLPPEGVLVGHVGRFQPVKNHAFLIRTFAALRPNREAAHLVLAGDGPLRQPIEDLVRALQLQDRVTFLGVRGDVPRLLAALDVFLLPSEWEGLGLTLVEAQAAGVPCLASQGVPPETDLGLGLTWFRDLNQGADCWAAAAAEMARGPRPDWSVRETALRGRGYDVHSVASRLTAIYGGAAQTATSRHA